MVILFLDLLESCFSVPIPFLLGGGGGLRGGLGRVALAMKIQFLANAGLFCMLREERSTNRPSVLISKRTERKQAVQNVFFLNLFAKVWGR